MGNVKPAPMVVPVAGFIARDQAVLKRAELLLEKRLGPVWRRSAIESFTHTRYYEAELGPNLLRAYCSFTHQLDAGELAALKHETNELELRLAAANGKRRINIDPGYLSAHSLILATTKQAAHRPYLGRGIYADLTYRFIRGGFEPLEWTYPDFRQPHVRRFFERLRQECLSMAVNKQAASV